MRSVYEGVYARSMQDPDGFWAAAAEAIHWEKRWDRVFDDSRPPFYRWFTGGVLNTCYNALDVHVDRGRAKQKALVYDSPVTGTVQAFTFAELRDEVARCAGMLQKLGIAKGDRVIIYMPMVPEAVVAMLACARLGGAIELARHKPGRCVILQRPQERAPLVAGRDLEWGDALAGARPADCVPVAATDPLYILYTSGTTGVPKGVVRDNGGHAVALAWSMPNVYGIQPGEVMWAASDIGWAVGHS